MKKKQNLITIMCSRDLLSVHANKISVVRHQIYSTSSFNNQFFSCQQDMWVPPIVRLKKKTLACCKETRVHTPAELQGKLQPSPRELVIPYGRLGGNKKTKREVGEVVSGFSSQNSTL